MRCKAIVALLLLLVAVANAGLLACVACFVPNCVLTVGDRVLTVYMQRGIGSPVVTKAVAKCLADCGARCT